MFRDVRNCIDSTSSYVKGLDLAAKQISLGTKTDVEKGLQTSLKMPCLELK